MVDLKDDKTLSRLFSGRRTETMPQGKTWSEFRTLPLYDNTTAGKDAPWTSSVSEEEGGERQENEWEGYARCWKAWGLGYLLVVGLSAALIIIICGHVSYSGEQLTGLVMGLVGGALVTVVPWGLGELVVLCSTRANNLRIQPCCIRIWLLLWGAAIIGVPTFVMCVYLPALGEFNDPNRHYYGSFANASFPELAAAGVVFFHFDANDVRVASSSFWTP